MKQFSKKTDVTLLCISIFLLILTSAIVLFSADLLITMQAFFERFFRRTVNLSKWSATIIALMTYPVFAVIFTDALLFVLFSDRSKNILLSAALSITAFFIIYLAYTRGPYCMDADTSAEMALAKECWISKTFWPRSWCYSTEIRILQAELLTVPLFWFTQSFRVIKAVSALLVSLCIPLSLYFLLSMLNIKKTWLKLLCCLSVFVPASESAWDYVQFGNWYAAHIALGFLYGGLFFGIVYNNFSKNKEAVFKYIFFALAFILGLTSMRYLVQFIGPLFLVYSLSWAVSAAKFESAYSFKDFIKEKAAFYSFFGLVISVAGFLFNQILLSRFYSFSFTGTFAFGVFGDVSFGTWFGGVLNLLGWRNNVAVLSPAGIVNVLVIIGVIAAVLCAFDFFKFSGMSVQKKFTVVFAITSIAVNIFAAACFEDFNEYYFMGPLAWIFPCAAIFAEEGNVLSLKRYACLFSLSVCVFTASFFTYGYVLSHNSNAERRDAAAFVENAGYTLGFSRREPSTIITYLTDGKVDMGLVFYERRKFLTSKRFWDDKFKADEKVFLLVSKDDFADYPELKELENCQEVYSNNRFTIFDFESKRLLKDELHKEKYERYLDPH